MTAGLRSGKSWQWHTRCNVKKGIKIMCLAVPGQIISIEGEEALLRSAQVRFGGVVREACLAFVPEAEIGDYVLVHAGIAISVLCEDAAESTLSYIENIL